MSMYAKLMSRITESSLMEEDLEVRYCFIMLLAIADMEGYAIGTDVALARRMNMPVAQFQRCVKELMKPDPDSNSKDEDGRRVIVSDAERGYFVVNYSKYRDTRNEEERREYMKSYMRKYRSGNKKAAVNSGKQHKPSLAHSDAESDIHSAIEPDKAGSGANGKPPRISPTVRNGDHGKFIHLWTENYPSHHDGAEYVFAGGKDGSAVSSLLERSKLLPDELMEFAVSAWKTPSGFNCKFAASISGFASRFNEIRQEINSAEKPLIRDERPASFRAPMNPPPQRPDHAK